MNLQFIPYELLVTGHHPAVALRPTADRISLGRKRAALAVSERRAAPSVVLHVTGQAEVVRQKPRRTARRHSTPAWSNSEAGSTRQTVRPVPALTEGSDRLADAADPTARRRRHRMTRPGTRDITPTGAIASLATERQGI